MLALSRLIGERADGRENRNGIRKKSPWVFQCHGFLETRPSTTRGELWSELYVAPLAPDLTVRSFRIFVFEPRLDITPQQLFAPFAPFAPFALINEVQKQRSLA